MHGNKVIIAGLPRCGSSWVTAVLGKARGYDCIFEPDNRSRLSSVPEILRWRSLESGDSVPELEAFFSSILGSAWLPAITIEHPRNAYERMSRLLAVACRKTGININRPLPVSDNRIIKLIYSPLLLTWLQSCFPDIRIAYIIRHPCGQFLSWQRRNWEPRPSLLFDQPALRDNDLQPYLQLHDSAVTFWERAGLLWGAAHTVLFRQIASAGNNIRVVRYEDICDSPVEQFAELFRYFDIEYDHRVEQFINVTGKPDSLGKQTPDSYFKIAKDTASQSRSWREKIDGNGYRECARYAGNFNLPVYKDLLTDR